jgi:hypothetical protein
MKGGKSLKKLSIRFMPIAPKARRNHANVSAESAKGFFDGHQKAKSKYEQDSQGNTQATRGTCAVIFGI